MIFSKDDRPAWGGMDLDRDHWGDESNGPPPGAALPPGASTSSVSGGIHPHPNAVAPPGTQGSQLFGPNHQGVEPAAVQQRTSNGAPQPPQQGPSGGIGGSNVPPHIRQNGKQIRKQRAKFGKCPPCCPPHSLPNTNSRYYVKNLRNTVWKFGKFSSSQILREINFQLFYKFKKLLKVPFLQI